MARVCGVLILLVSGVLAGEISVDGVLDEPFWQSAERTVIDGRDHIHPSYRAGWSGPDDLSAVVRTRASEGVLYLALEVRDETRMHVAGREFWVGDSVEVFLDTDLVSDEPGDRYTDDDLQLFLMPFNRELRWGVVARGPGRPYPSGGLSGVEVGYAETADGYVVEARIPLEGIGPLRPDRDGHIGFDIALNDVDDAAATQAETYMTLSGRFELSSTPGNFSRLAIGPPPAAREASAPPTDWPTLLGGVAVLGFALVVARLLARRMERETRSRAALLSAAFLAGAGLLAALPTAARWVDDKLALGAAEEALAATRSAAQAYLDLDAGPVERRAADLRALFRDGRAPLHPRYRYECVALTPRPTEGVLYGIELAPGEARTFPLEGRATPDRLRLMVRHPEPGARDRADAPAEVRIGFADGTALEAAGRAQVLLDTGARAGTRLRSLEVRNSQAAKPLFVDALYGEAAGVWRAMPLATRTASGVPLDVWHDRPVGHIITVPPGSARSVEGIGLAGDRLWLALGAEGAYPASAYGVGVARVAVHYRDGDAGPVLSILNGQDVQDHRIVYARKDAGVALEWEDKSRFPKHYTLHQIRLDPSRAVDRIEIEDLGVLQQLQFAAATIGRREAAAPAPSSGLRVQGETVLARKEVTALWKGLGFSVRTATGPSHSCGPIGGVAAPIHLDGADIEVWLPHGRLARAIESARAAVFGLAVLLLSLAVLAAGAGLLQRARHLRSKMLGALGAATAVPLLFLFFSLSTLLTEQAEERLEASTRADLQAMEARIAGAQATARTMASRARERIEFAKGRIDAARRTREEIESQGGFLRVPELDGSQPSSLGNVSFVDAVARSGLYCSPWDGLIAVGVARSPEARRYLVGLRGRSVIGDGPAPDVGVVVYGPDGGPVAATAGLRPPRRPALREQLERSVRPLYTRREGDRAAAHALLRDGERVVGVLGVYRSRARTEAQETTIFRTLLLSGLGALTLVVLAGGLLVERVASRLGRVTRTARSIAQGELQSRVPVEGGDEVGRLATSFNQMADALGERMRQLTELQRGLHALTAALDRGEVAVAAAELLQRATGARHVLVAAIDGATERVEVLCRIGEGAPIGRRLPVDGPAREAVTRHEPIHREGAVFLPLVASGRPVGLAVCSPVEPGRALDRDFLDLSGRQIGIALENARLYQAAVTDELTGLYTYAFFVRRLKEEVDRAAALHRPLSLLRVVIDDYASIARGHGVAGAARTVVAAAAAVSTVLPPRNMVARRDNGELLVLLVESGANDVARRRDEVATALEQVDARFSYRAVTFPRDGAAADILLDSLFEVTEILDVLEGEPGPALMVPAGLVLGRGATMRAVLEVVARVAPTNATVLLGGETGTGKEALADVIQCNSDRREGPYVKVDCAAIPANLIESELFGHERGSFTGADRRRIGRFEEAHRGTLFLDEVGELPVPMQATLLRVLQERKLRRVGGSASIATDARIIAASNRDLGEAVRQGQFREDLFHRLHVIELRVPPLRERRDEIAPLIEHFRNRFNRHHGLSVEGFTPAALDALYRHPWPGNVRELRNVVERALVLAGAGQVERTHLSLPQAGGSDAPARVDGLTPRQERILALSGNAEGVTNGAVVAAEEVSPRTALRELQVLVDRGLLVRVGRRRGATYRVARP